jgi:phosphoglycolate phosphatase
MILVLFDCDGTLVDSQHGIAEAMARTFEEHGLRAPALKETRRIVGLSLPGAIAELLDEVDAARCDDMAETYKRHFHALRSAPDFHEPLFAGAREAVGRLARQEEVLIGMVTGKSRRGVDAVLGRHGLREAFQVVRTADDCPSKPHPAMVLECCAESGIGPEATLVIGDTVFDMGMAVAAGAVPLGVCWGYHERQELLEAGAHRVLNDFDELENAAAALQHGGGEHAAC